MSSSAGTSATGVAQGRSAVVKLLTDWGALRIAAGPYVRVEMSSDKKSGLVPALRFAFGCPVTAAVSHDPVLWLYNSTSGSSTTWNVFPVFACHYTLSQPGSSDRGTLQDKLSFIQPTSFESAIATVSPTVNLREMNTGPFKCMQAAALFHSAVQSLSCSAVLSEGWRCWCRQTADICQFVSQTYDHFYILEHVVHSHLLHSNYDSNTFLWN